MNPNNNNQGQGLVLTVGQESILPSAIKPRHLLSSPVINGDLYYSANGSFARLAVGKTGQQLMVINGLPTWVNFPQTGLAAALPATGRYLGDQFYETDSKKLNIWDGSVWRYSSFT